jgi:murein DD-endopeptidase MepM/ murein hydrolase activator NlpD
MFGHSEVIGFGDSTGFSTGHHLHFGIRPLYQNKESFNQLLWDNGYFGYQDPEEYLPKIYWGIDDLLDEDKLMSKINKKLIFNNKTGEIGWFYDGKLRVPSKARLPELLASYLVRKEGVNVSPEDWDKIKKTNF